MVYQDVYKIRCHTFDIWVKCNFHWYNEELRNKHFYYHIAIYISFRKSGRSCFLRWKKTCLWKRHWYYVHIMRKLRFDDVHHMELIPMYTNRKPCGNTDSLRPSVKRINGWYVSRKLHPSYIILGNFSKFKF